MSRIGAQRGSVSHWFTRCVLLLLSTWLAAEVALHVASHFVRDRSENAAPDGRRAILALGDSHTYGVLVPAAESYPAHLQALLDETAPDTYSVINLGVPGMSTSQMRARMPEAIDRFAPDLVIIWCGVNNSWNVTESEIAPVTTGEWLDGMMAWSRVYRLIRVAWAAPRRPPQPPHAVTTDGRRQQVTPVEGHRRVFRVDHGAGTEIIGHKRADTEFDHSITEERAYTDYMAIAEQLRLRGVPVIFVAYPMRVGAFVAANAALARLSRETDVTVVQTRDAVARVPEERREWLWGAHPNGPMYQEIARELLPTVLHHFSIAKPR